MLLSNFHSHCSFCDGQAPMETFVQFAISKGLKAYGISSHAPVPFDNAWSLKSNHLEEYIQEFHRLKGKYNEQIDLYIGMEMDYLAKEKDIVFRNHQDVNLDYRIGSVHYIDTLDNGELYWNVGGNPHNYDRGLKEIYGNSFRKMITRYYDMTMQMVDICPIDIVGHLDKITDIAERLYPNEFSPEDKWYTNLLYQVLELIKSKNIIVEINTKGVHIKGRTFPHQRHLKLLKDMRIPVMVNSDAHRPELITSGFSFAEDILRNAGINEVTILRDGVWNTIPITQ